MKILNFGSCNIDYVYSLSHIVKEGETLHSNQLNIFPGGKGLNQSIALARAGAKVFHAGCIGSDGEFLTDILINSGVNTSYIKNVEDKNGHAIIQVSNDGENSIFLHSGSNSMITKEQIDSVLSDFESGDIILLQNEISNVNYIIEQAYNKKMCIILNPSPINDELLKIDFNMLSYIILNEIEARDITGTKDFGQALEYFSKTYPNLKVMLTLGQNGCIYRYKDETYSHPIYDVTAVDTTAAGDTFTGYFVSAISKGENIEFALKKASCASAITVSKHGASTAIPSLEEVLYGIKNFALKANNKKQELLLKKIEDYFSEHIATVSLKGLANSIGYSTVYTGNLIKQLTGMTYNEYLQSKRISLAVDLLKNTTEPINEIIKKCGYKNESFFRKIFKQKYGVNPLEYRKTGVKKP